MKYNAFYTEEQKNMLLWLVLLELRHINALFDELFPDLVSI